MAGRGISSSLRDEDNRGNAEAPDKDHPLYERKPTGDKNPAAHRVMTRVREVRCQPEALVYNQGSWQFKTASLKSRSGIARW
jgi:hypothetical protein